MAELGAFLATWQDDAMAFARIEDGQVTGLATYSDRWKIFQQLGVLDLC